VEGRPGSGLIGILGPVELIGEEPVPLGGVKERCLLAALAVHCGAAVSAASLVDALWGDDPSRTATPVPATAAPSRCPPCNSSWVRSRSSGRNNPSLRRVARRGRFIPYHPICPASLTWSVTQRTCKNRYKVTSTRQPGLPAQPGKPQTGRSSPAAAKRNRSEPLNHITSPRHAAKTPYWETLTTPWKPPTTRSTTSATAGSTAGPSSFPASSASDCTQIVTESIILGWSGLPQVPRRRVCRASRLR
jgi:hypothetical protein